VWSSRSILSGTARYQVAAAETPRRYANAYRTTIRRKASWVVPPFSLDNGEDLTPLEGGRWDDPGQAGKTDLARSREACAAAAVGRLGTDAMVPEDDKGRQRTGQFR